MKGRPVGDQLEKVRAVCCARNGLKLAHDETPAEDEIGRLHSVYLAPESSFVVHMASRIAELNEAVILNEDPTDAIELCMVAGLLVDRMTNRQLLESNGLRRTRSGVAFDNAMVHTTVEATPYHGKDQ